MQQSIPPLELATVGTLQSLLSQEVKAYRKAKRDFRKMLAFTVLLHLTAYNLVFYIADQESARVFLMLLVAWATAPSLFARYEAQQASRRRVYDVVNLLHKYQERNSIGVLIEAMEAGDEATANLARLAVIAILPSLQATDAPLLESRHRTYLHRALRGTNSELILAILQALEQVGDRKAIPYVKRLIPCPVWLWRVTASRRLRAGVSRYCRPKRT